MVNVERLKRVSKLIRDYSIKFKEQPDQKLDWTTLKKIADKLDEILVDGE